MERQVVADELPRLAVGGRRADHHPVGGAVVGVDGFLDAHDLPAVLDERPQLLQDRIVAPTRQAPPLSVSSYVSRAPPVSPASAPAPSGSPFGTPFMMGRPPLPPPAA